MHQLIIHIQGGPKASLAQTIAALDLVKGRLMAGMSNGVVNDGPVGAEFEAREVDIDQVIPGLIHQDAMQD